MKKGTYGYFIYKRKELKYEDNYTKKSKRNNRIITI